MVLSTTILRSLSYATILFFAEKKEHLIGSLLVTIAINCLTSHLEKRQILSIGLKNSIDRFAHGFAWGASGICFGSLSKQSLASQGLNESFVYGFIPTLQMNLSMAIIRWLCPSNQNTGQQKPQATAPASFKMLPEYQALAPMLFKGVIKDWGLLENLSSHETFAAKLAISVGSYIALEAIQLAPLSNFKTSALYIKSLDRGIASFTSSCLGHSSLQYTKNLPSSIRSYLFSVAYGLGAQMWTDVTIKFFSKEQTKAETVLAEKAKPVEKSL